MNPSLPEPESLADFLAWKPPHIRETISNGLLVPEGKMIIFGPKKSWKSMTAIDLAFCLSTGTPWLGFKTTLSTVLIIQLEIPKFSYQERVQKYSIGNKLAPMTNLFLVTIRNLKLDKGWGESLLDKWIVQYHPQVVIIDPAYKVISGRLTDEYDVRQFTDRIDHLAELHHCAFVVIHHEGKDMIIDGTRYDRGADAAFGSAAFGWWVDTSIEVRAISEGSNVIDMRFPLVRLGTDNVDPIRVEINRENLVFTNKGGTAGED